jgi:4-amino-4-deoxy-L-arabinose transferase-like glycosyltransferase
MGAFEALDVGIFFGVHPRERKTLFRRGDLSNFKPMLPPGPRRSLSFGPPGLRSLVLTAAVTALLGLFWWLAVSASRVKSQTSDELPHIAAGYAYDRFGDFRIQPENGNLPQRLYGLPGLAAGARFPLDAERWSVSQYWHLAWDYFYALDNPTDRIVQQARSINALIGAALGLLIFLLARARFGDAGGLLALGFYVLAPNFLAHSALATSDVCATFFLTLSPWLFWRHLEKRDWPSGALAGLVSGLTLVAKFNGLLLAPIYALLIIADVWLRADSSARIRRLITGFALAVAQAAAGIFVVWAFFNFRFSGRGPGMPELISYSWAWAEMFPSLGAKRVVIEAALRWHLMPEAWLYGLTNVLAGETVRPAFLAGEHSQRGWWQFFPTLFVTKTPLALLGAFLLALGAGVFAWRRASALTRQAWLVAACPLSVTALVVWGTALLSHLNIGDRHILAIFPPLFVALGILASRRLLIVALALLAGHAAASFAIRPHYLAYFNALAGGPENAYRLFSDSSLDWGQDLPTLRTWLASSRHPGEKFYLGYFGSAWAPHYGVRPDYFLPTANYIVRPPQVPYALEPGLYCISATVLNEVYSIHRGPWTSDQEAKWQRWRTVPPTRDEFSEFDLLRFARLCKFLQLRPTDANAGYSILIFRLSAAELRSALEGPVTGAYHLRALGR